MFRRAGLCFPAGECFMVGMDAAHAARRLTLKVQVV